MIPLNKNKMKTKLLLSTFLIVALISNAQITTNVSSLPDAGDVLNYKNLDIITDEFLFFGEDVTWDFTGMIGEVPLSEEYLDASTGVNYDQFADTDVLLNLFGAEAYANRNTTNIEIVGIAGGQLLDGLELAEAQEFSEPYVIRRAPLGFGDTYSGTTSFGFSVDIEDFGPLADIIEELNPVEGASVDSIRMTFTLNRSEEVDSYGAVLIGDDSIDALRLVQNDETEIGIDIYVVTGIVDTWISVTDFVDLGELGFEDLVTTNYIFLDETSKEYLLEVNVDQFTQVATGRYNADFTNSIHENSPLLLSVFPNPTSDLLVINGANLSSIDIFNELGQVVISEKLNKKFQIEFSLASLANGLYIVKAQLENGEHITSRIIKE